MTSVEMKRKFKNKDGFTRISMIENQFGKIKIKISFCYPAIQEGKFVEYVQSVWEANKEEANEFFLESQKRGFTNKVTRR